MENKDRPAFPQSCTANGTGVYLATAANTESEAVVGLTKREMVAAQLDVSKDMENWSLGFFESLMGCSPPANQVDNYKWWAEAEAKLRVMKADALLAELSKS